MAAAAAVPLTRCQPAPFQDATSRRKTMGSALTPPTRESSSLLLSPLRSRLPTSHPALSCIPTPRRRPLSRSLRDPSLPGLSSGRGSFTRSALATSDPASPSPPARETGGSSGPIAFFDVDGTILKSNVVTAFLTLKLHDMALAERVLFLPWFALQVALYLVLDRIDRALFNRVFYRNYRGIAVGKKQAMAELLHRSYVLPRIMPGAQAHVQGLRDQGYSVVLVTGSLDFLMEPLAELLGCEAVFAARLKEEYGRFSGELEGEAVSSSEKAQLARAYAAERGVDMALCHAYGDSVADLAMLEAVGFPHAVHPEKRLLKISQERGWPVVNWGEAHAATPRP